MGVHTPTEYGPSGGVIYQVYVPDVVNQEAISRNSLLLGELCHIAAVLDWIGWQPLDFLRDLRADAMHVYYVDVGEDLGDPGGMRLGIAKKQLLAFLHEGQIGQAESLYERHWYNLERKERSVTERTLVVMKPDVLERHLLGRVVSYLESADFALVAMDLRMVTRDFVQRHYPDSMARTLGAKSAEAGDTVANLEEQGKLVLGWLRDYLSRGSVVALVLEGKDAIRLTRQIVGHTDPSAAEKGTIRGDLGVDSILAANRENRACENLIHASGTAKEAAREIGLWFGALPSRKADHGQDERRP
jgi:nucleoside-diphosphate kinase